MRREESRSSRLPSRLVSSRLVFHSFHSGERMNLSISENQLNANCPNNLLPVMLNFFKILRKLLRKLRKDRRKNFLASVFDNTCLTMFRLRNKSKRLAPDDFEIKDSWDFRDIPTRKRTPTSKIL